MSIQIAKPTTLSRLPRAAFVFLTAMSLASLPAIGGAQGRRGGGGDSGGGSQRGGGSDSPSRRDDTPSRRDDTPSRRDDGPSRRDDAPARREEPSRRDNSPSREEYRAPSRRDDAPSRRDDTPYRREDRPSRGDDSGSRGNVNRPGRDDTSADRPTNRDRIDAGRTNPRDDIRADRPSDRSTDRDRDRAPRTDDRNPRNDDRYQRSDRNNPGTDRDRNPSGQDRDRRPSDNSGRENGGGGIFDRNRPGGDTRPDRDYRGDPYNGGRRDNDRNNDRTNDRVNNRGNDGRTGSNRYDGYRRDHAQDLFSRSREGRQYNNGIALRSGGYISDRYLRGYFPRGYSYYPYYYPRYDVSLVYFSPYGYYYGVCAPYIYRRHCSYYPPVSVWIDIPIYTGVEFRSWRGYDDDYYLDRRDYYSDPSQLPDRDLEVAVRDLRESFRFGDINLLTNLTDPSVRIAVFLKGKYEYSMNSSDYLDMTRDMFATTETVQFDLDRIRRRSPDVYVASGKQVYLNRDNRRRTVYLSFVFERVHGRWTVTQVGTAPDRIEEPRD